MAYCINCGRRVPENASYCPDCGTDLRVWTKPANPQPEQKTVQEAPVEQTLPAQPQNIPEQPVQPERAPTQPEYPYAQPMYPAQQGYYYSQPVYAAKPEPVPGKGMSIVGKIMGIVGFVESIGGLAITLMLMIALISLSDVYSYWAEYGGGLLTDFVVMACETLALCILGVVLSSKAAAKGNPNTKAGKRFGWIGIVFSAVTVVNIILCVIVFAFSGATSFV